MRTKNSLLNILSNCTCYVIWMISGFFIRKTFSDVLGLQCVGIEGRFADYVSILSIIELGLGMSFVYKLYDPIAKKDWSRVSIVINFLKKSYFIIMAAIFLVGLIASFFIIDSIKEDFSKQWLMRIFLLYLIDAVCSYVYYHKRIMIIADQNSRIIGLTRTCCLVGLMIAQILILRIFKSFELYIFAKIISRMTENFVISYYFHKKYAMIDMKSKVKLDKEQKKDVIQNIKAMFFHKIGGASLKQISTIIFGMIALPLAENGIYCNYMIIVAALLGISLEFFKGIMASFGNLLSTEKGEKIENNFNIIFLLNFLMYSFFCSAFLCVSEPFMRLWITSENSVFPVSTTVAIVIYIYIFGMRHSIDMAKDSAGIYIQDRYFPVIESAINFVISYFLAKKFGIKGAILGSVIASFLTSFFTHPYFVYKIVFKKGPFEYYKKYFLYTFITFFEVLACYFCTNAIQVGSNFAQMVINFILCLIISSFVNIILFHRTKEFAYILSMVSKFFSKIKKIRARI